MRAERYVGIDYLRAFFSVCVVLVHLGYISRSAVFDVERYSDHTLTLSDLLNFYVLLLAVPVFFLASNYLFFKKPEETSVLFAYLKRIGKIATFWILLHNLFIYRGWEILWWLPTSPAELAGFILSGGHTIYYFFVSLIGLTVVTHFSKRLRVSKVFLLFVVSTLLLSLLPVLSIATGHFILSKYWNPLNFLPYPFAAILVFHLARLERKKIKPVHILLAGLLTAAFLVADWTLYVHKGFFTVNTYAIPSYTRPSLVPLSMAVFVLAIKVKPKGNRVIRFMSNNSLALYCLHPFFAAPARALSGGRLFVSLLIVLALSYLTAMFMKRFIRQEIIR